MVKSTLSTCRGFKSHPGLLFTFKRSYPRCSQIACSTLCLVASLMFAYVQGHAGSIEERNLGTVWKRVMFTTILSLRITVGWATGLKNENTDSTLLY